MILPPTATWNITFLNLLVGLPSSIVASRVTPQSYFLLQYKSQQVNNGFNSDFNSDLKVSSLYNIGHNKQKALPLTKLQFKADKDPRWHRILDAVGCSFPLLIGRAHQTSSSNQQRFNPFHIILINPEMNSWLLFQSVGGG